MPIRKAALAWLVKFTGEMKRHECSNFQQMNQNPNLRPGHSPLIEGDQLVGEHLVSVGKKMAAIIDNGFNL